MKNRMTNALLAVIAALLAATIFAPQADPVASAQRPAREADRVRSQAALPYTSGVEKGELVKLNVSPFTLYTDNGAGGWSEVCVGEPAWIALTPASGWANVGGSYPTLAYRKRCGRLELRGAIAGAGTTMFVLPSGYYIGDGLFRRFTVSGQQGGVNTPTLLQRVNADVNFIGGATDFVSFDGVSLPLS
jgi:hypothetical protein